MVRIVRNIADNINNNNNNIIVLNNRDRRVTLKVTKRTPARAVQNLKGDSYYVIKDVVTGNVRKIKIEKEAIELNKYKVSPVLNYDVVKKQILTKNNVKKLIKGLKLEFKQLDRRTKTSRPIEINILNKDNLNVTLLNNNKWGFEVYYSNVRERRYIDPLNFGTFKGNISDLEELIVNYILDYFEDWCDYISLITPIELIDNNSINLKFHYVKEMNGNEDYYIEKKNKYAELINLFNEKIEPVDNPASENCVIYFFNQLHKKKQRKIYKLISQQLQEVENKKKTIYLKDLINILKNHEITIYIYSINGVEYEKYSKNYTETSKLETIVIYIEDNHLYVVKSNKHKNHLTKRKIDLITNSNIEYNNELDDNKLLSSKVISYNNCASTGIAHYLLHNEDKLITNNDNCVNMRPIYTKIGLDIKNININFTSFIVKNKSKYNINHYSIFPFKVTNDVLRYKNNDIIQDENEHLINIDKNKCFSNALYDLPFIPHFCILSDVYRQYDDNEIIKDNYLYYIEVKELNEIYFNNGYWFGWFIKKYGGLDNIKIKYVFECNILNDNPYRVMINDLYTSCETKEQTTYIKNSINAYIGQMLRPEKKEIKYKDNLKITTYNDILLMNNNLLEKYKKEYNIDGDINIDLDKMQYDDKLKLLLLSDSSFHCDLIKENIICYWNNKNIKNYDMGKDNKPLNIMIRNKAQSYIIDMMQNLKIEFNDIIEINTDCIYIKNGNKYNIDKILNNKDDLLPFTGWKVEHGYKKTQLENAYHRLNKSIIECEKYFYDDNNNKYNFYLQYAGGGKSHSIMTTINENLKKNKDYSYIILSPFHDFLSEFRKKGYNASTIAQYKYNNAEIKEKNIFIDEWGICSIEDNLFLLRHLNKNFYFYGDILQLKPVDSEIMNVDFINNIATKISTKWTNYRNTFTKEFYDDLINNGNDYNKINEMLLTYNSHIKDADIIIAYYNETVDKYNKLLLKNNKKSFNIKKISEDIPIINMQNKLPILCYDTNEIEYIYNRHSFKTCGEEDEYIIIKDDLKKYKVDKNTIINNFKLGYCITLYAAQGKTYKKIHYVNEQRDIKALSKQGALYTLISRLKFNNKEKYEVNVLNNNIKYDNIEINNIMKECGFF